MLTVITLPGNFAASTTAFMSDMFGDLSPYTTLILGIILTLVVVEILVHAIRPK